MRKTEIIVSGIVQGVGYRFFAARVAHSLDIRGSVKNTTGGDVKIIAIGEEKNIGIFIEELRKGSSMARVEKMKISELSSTKGYENFSIEYK